MTRFRRKNTPTRRRAKQLLQLWYEIRVDRREHRFADAKRVSRETSTPAPREPSQRRDPLKPLTADGKETRPPPKRSKPVQAMDIDAAGHQEDHPEYLFARRVMLHMINCSGPEVHAALEMRAAGFEWLAAAEELGCGEQQARNLYEEGLAVISSCQILRNDLGW